MHTLQEVVKQSELLARLVRDRRTAEPIGHVEELWLNPQEHQIVGFTCKSDLIGRRNHSFTWAHITLIGTDSILVEYNPDELEPEKPDYVFSAIGHEVWTNAGNKAGQVVDYLVVPQTSRVMDYLFRSSGWRGVADTIYMLPTTAIITVGSDRMMVSDADLQTPARYAEELYQKVTDPAINAVDVSAQLLAPEREVQ